MYLMFDPCVCRCPLSQYDEVEVSSWTRVGSDDHEWPARNVYVLWLKYLA